MSPSQQWYTLGWMFSTGFAIGLIFDLYRVFRGLARPRWFLTALGDTIFWLLTATFTYLVLLWVNFGEVRFFVFLGIILGLAVYYKVFSQMVLSLIHSCILFLRKVWGFFRRLWVIVIIGPLALVLAVLLWPVQMLWSGYKKVAKRVQRRLQRSKLYWGKKTSRLLRTLYRLVKSKVAIIFRKK